MEDVLELYKRPYDPLCPVVCVDETNRKLIEQRSIPAKPGNPELVDYEYRRCGVADLFVAFKSLGCRRIVKVTANRKAVDFAQFIRELVDVHYPHAEKIILVMDNLNIHGIASLYRAFAPGEARRIAEKLEFHHTPTHASWLNMDEIEIGILSRQCLDGKMSHIDEMCRKVSSWQCRRNAESSTVHWRFITTDARIKLRKLYPTFS